MTQEIKIPIPNSGQSHIHVTVPGWAICCISQIRTGGGYFGPWLCYILKLNWGHVISIADDMRIIHATEKLGSSKGRQEYSELACACERGVCVRGRCIRVLLLYELLEHRSILKPLAAEFILRHLQAPSPRLSYSF